MQLFYILCLVNFLSGILMYPFLLSFVLVLMLAPNLLIRSAKFSPMAKTSPCGNGTVVSGLRNQVGLSRELFLNLMFQKKLSDPSQLLEGTCPSRCSQDHQPNVLSPTLLQLSGMFSPDWQEAREIYNEKNVLAEFERLGKEHGVVGSPPPPPYKSLHWLFGGGLFLLFQGTSLPGNLRVVLSENCCLPRETVGLPSPFGCVVIG